MDYKDTLNLPKTDFQMKANLPKNEPNILDYWNKIDIYNKILKKNKDKEKFILHDGPPYANGHIHMGHALNKILKDFIVKFNLINGKYTPYVPGWDCHGLPVELMVVKEITQKGLMLSKIGLRKECRKYADKYIEIQKKEFLRLGLFGDWEHPYKTMNFDYEADILEIFTNIYKHGYIYKGFKPIHWCFNCNTALAEAEVEYKEKSSVSIYVRLKVLDQENLYFVIWTTTSWTLPANLAVAVHPGYQYSKVRVKGKKTSDEQNWIIATNLVNTTMSELNIKEYEVIETFAGEKLESYRYRHPLYKDKILKVVLADYVTLDQGTGCVHTAPGHGTEDYETGIKYGLEIFSPVDINGNFTAEAGDLEGINVFDANEKIIKTLKDNGSLLHKHSIKHSYPHCWRCKKPLIFRATKQWFFSTERGGIRNKVLDAVKDVKWIPDWGMERFSNMITNRSDWCLSRQRVWGVPIPALFCPECEKSFINEDLLEKLIEKFRESGSDVWFDMDLKDLIDTSVKCPRCENKDLEKEIDILDVWFDSGISWYTVCAKDDKLGFPVDIYIEGSDQYRGWFQSSIWPSIAVKGTPPYRTVISHGFMLDQKGHPMHKSLGNVVEPQEIIKKYGADVLRLWVSSENYQEDLKLSWSIIGQIVDSYRKIRNTFKFLLSNINDFNVQKNSVSYENLTKIDRWILAKLYNFSSRALEHYKNFEFYKVYHLVNTFCTVELSANYLDMIKMRLYTYKKDSQARRAAQTTCYTLLKNLLLIISPLLSFTAEEAYLKLNEKESVFLEEWPVPKDEWKNPELLKKFNTIKELRETVLMEIEKKRKEKEIGHSLDVDLDLTVNNELKDFVNDLDLREFFIVSNVKLKIGEKSEVVVNKAEGKKCIRCWRISKTVGKDSKHPEVCETCIRHLT